MSRRSSAALSTRQSSAFGIAAMGVLTLSGSLVATSDTHDDIVIQPQTVVWGQPGSVSTVANDTVPDKFVGKVCDMTVSTENNGSIHPGTTVIVTSGPSSITVNGVENSPNAAVLNESRVTLGNRIVVDVKLGADGVSSMGFTVSFDCTPTVAPAGAQTGPTTTTPPSTAKPTVAGVVVSNTAPPTTAAPTTASTAAVKKAPSVLGKQQAAALPKTPAAKATVANPNFTG